MSEKQLLNYRHKPPKWEWPLWVWIFIALFLFGIMIMIADWWAMRGK